jgi:hypothetical protein
VVAKALATASLVAAKAILISMALAASSGIPITGYQESERNGVAALHHCTPGAEGPDVQETSFVDFHGTVRCGNPRGGGAVLGLLGLVSSGAQERSLSPVQCCMYP